MIETAVGGGVVVLLIGVVSNRLFKRMDEVIKNGVKKEVYEGRHKSLEKLIKIKFEHNAEILEDIKKKLDKLNNVNKTG